MIQKQKILVEMIMADMIQMTIQKLMKTIKIMITAVMIMM